jgi:hypothetical protein
MDRGWRLTATTTDISGTIGYHRVPKYMNRALHVKRKHAEQSPLSRWEWDAVIIPQICNEE